MTDKTAICQSLGATDERKRAVKNKATTGAISGKIGVKIALDNPSKPSALFLSFSKPVVASCAEKLKSDENGHFSVACS